jgi:hypothetical protein
MPEALFRMDVKATGLLEDQSQVWNVELLA